MIDPSEFLNSLRASRRYRGQIVHVHDLPARAAEFADPAEPLPAVLAGALAAEGIRRPYSHQAAAIDLLRAGKDVVIVTGTASGKTMCYNLPVLDTLLAEPDARALYMFPTKALAQDQLATLQRWAAADPQLKAVLRPATYDGDTPTHQRTRIKQAASVILTNPDMLHVGVLPYHAKWAMFFANLRYVVIDELHTYRGIFGSHVANVLRRLRRVCRFYGSDPQFICTSATIANPRQLAEQVTGRPMELIDRDGSPRGRKLFVLWNPPLVGGDVLARRSANIEAQELMVRLVESGVQTIAFTKARVVAELIYRYVRDELLRRRHPKLAEAVRAYRGGYLPAERRQIEQELFSGRLRGVCSTNALELGIDVGSLDAAILVGLPPTIASTWQQAGRAGRANEQSLAVLIAYNDPVDQYVMHHPDYFFGQAVEHGVVDPQNPYILSSHLGCAAFELPLAEEDQETFGPMQPQLAEVLAETGQLHKADGRWFWSSPAFPAGGTALRTISNDTYSIVDTSSKKHEVIGQVDSISAPELVYPAAVYLHDGATYLVRELDTAGKVAYIERAEVDYYTQPVLASDCRILATQTEKQYRAGKLAYGDVRVFWQTTAFKKFKFYTMENIGQTALDLPGQEMETTAFWYVPPDALLEAIREADHVPIEGLIGVRNLMLAALPLLAMCDRRDVSGQVDSANLGRPCIIMYDRYPGGLGFAQKGYEWIDRLVEMCRTMVTECPCDDGCPSCVGIANMRPPIHMDPDLGAGYPVPSKAATILALQLLCQWSGK